MGSRRWTRMLFIACADIWNRLLDNRHRHLAGGFFLRFVGEIVRPYCAEIARAEEDHPGEHQRDRKADKVFQLMPPRRWQTAQFESDRAAALLSRDVRRRRR